MVRSRSIYREISYGCLRGVVLDNKTAAYVGSVLPEQDEKDPFMYLQKGR